MIIQFNNPSTSINLLAMGLMLTATSMKEKKERRKEKKEKGEKKKEGGRYILLQQSILSLMKCWDIPNIDETE